MVKLNDVYMLICPLDDSSNLEKYQDSKEKLFNQYVVI